MDLGDIEKPRETLNECQHHLDQLRQLQGLASWDLLCRYFEDSAGYVERTILATAISPDMIYQQEFMKGRASTLRRIKDYVNEYCETLEDNIKRILDTMRTPEEEEDAGRDHSFDYRAESAGAEPDAGTPVTGTAP